MTYQKPLLIYDGDCGFCRSWVEKWRNIIGDQIQYEAYQNVGEQFPEINKEDFESSIKLICQENGKTKIYNAAEAAFVALSYNPSFKFLLWLYKNLPGFKLISETFYKLVASNRMIFSKLMFFFENFQKESSRTLLIQDLFIRALGVIYFIAFGSLLTQIKGLIGKNGILPIAESMPFIKQALAGQIYKFPTLFWFNTSDQFIILLLILGIIFSSLLVLNLIPRLALFLNFVIYLSFTLAARNFLSFQWDILLLETGFLAFFLLLFRVGSFGNSLALFSLRFLLFKLMFMSGLVKLSSGDSSWHNLTALNYHYETQPIPNPISFYAHQLPEQIQKISTVIMFLIELALPWFIFCGRNARIIAFAGLTILQLLIIATGNYCFFNLLTIALCFLLVDDGFIKKYMPFLLWGTVNQDIKARSQAKLSPLSFLPSSIFIVVFCLIFPINIFYINRAYKRQTIMPKYLKQIVQYIQPFHIANPYGLFAVMTTKRNEIIIEGSNDGQNWQAYEFKWKPGDTSRIPAQVAPHQPRLDWQMWFAALGNYRQQKWFQNFVNELLNGSPEVLKLLEKNPFPNHPPKYIRALFYEYKFTDLETQKKTSQYWKRELKSLYMPIAYKKP